MTPILVDWAIRSTLLLALGLAGGFFLRHRPAAYRHALLAVTLVGAGLLPALQPLMPPLRLPVGLGRPAPAVQVAQEAPASLPEIHWSVSAGRQAFDFAPSLPQEPPTPAVPPRRPLPVIPAVAIAVPLLLVLRRVLAVAWLSAKARCGRRSARLDAAVTYCSSRLALRRTAEARLLDQSTCPTAMTWGHRRPIVAMPTPAEEWPDGRIAGVVLHELAHAKRGDWLVQQVAAVAASALWFNPLAWLAFRRLRSAAECAADDLVLQTGVEPAAYAQHLLESVRAHPYRRSRFAFAGVDTMTNSHFETRIKSIIGFADRRKGAARSAALVVAGLAVASTLALAAAQVGRASTDSSKGRSGALAAQSDTAIVAQDTARAQARAAAAKQKLSQEGERRAEARRQKLVAALKANGKLSLAQRKALLNVLAAQQAELAKLRAEDAQRRANAYRQAVLQGKSMLLQERVMEEAARAEALAQKAEAEKATRAAQAGMADALRQLRQAQGREALEDAVRAEQAANTAKGVQALRDTLEHVYGAQTQGLRSARLSEAQAQALRDALKALDSQNAAMKQQIENAMKQLEEALEQLKSQVSGDKSEHRALSESIRNILRQYEMDLESVKGVREAIEAAIKADMAKLKLQGGQGSVIEVKPTTEAATSAILKALEDADKAGKK